jgi:hypothetical protein
MGVGQICSAMSEGEKVKSVNKHSEEIWLLSQHNNNNVNNKINYRKR